MSTQQLRELESQGDYSGLIQKLHDMVAADGQVLSDGFVKEWCGRRWRNLFLEQAVLDKRALKEAKRWWFDRRPPRRRIAERFLIGRDRGEWRIEMPAAQATRIDQVTLVFCPGLLTGLLPVRAFEEALVELQAEWCPRIFRVDSHPLAGCEANASKIGAALATGQGRDAAGNPIPAQDAQAPGDIFFLCYSKGGPDLVTFLAQNPEVKRRVRCIFFWTSPLAGTPLADQEYPRIQKLDPDRLNEPLGRFVGRFLRPFHPGGSLEDKVGRIAETDIEDAVYDLTTERNRAFLAEHESTLEDMAIPIFTFGGSTRLLEVPFFQRGAYRTVKQAGANDMQVPVVASRLSLPLATELAVLHGHHWDLAYPAFLRGSPTLSHRFPKTAALVAMVQLAAELGLIG